MPDYVTFVERLRTALKSLPSTFENNDSLPILREFCRKNDAHRTGAD
jgi:hypothetical protein